MPESLSLAPGGPAPGLRLLWSAMRGVVMCTYLTEKVSISGSGKGPSGWFTVTDASVYFDHPVHAPAEHTLNIDFLDPGAGPSARVAVELTAESARALAQAIQATLDAVPPGLV
jgi:Family of unknown function (DUF6295)